MKKYFRLLLSLLLFPLGAIFAFQVSAQTIQVNPNGVNVNAQGSTVVFLTFGRMLPTHVPAEACWCAELVPAVSGLGMQCNPAKIFGCLPSRFNLSGRSGTANLALTDIMSIPPSVSRRAYQAAVDGDVSSFFYVRRFIDTAGGPDEFVNVTCRMSGGGPRTPFALTDVKLSFAVDKLVLLTKQDQVLPKIKADIAYNGSGRLKGRWEIVLPGEESPSDTDLLTEASLPIEERAKQRRYTQLSTFNVFLPPGSKYTLLGPDETRLPRTVMGEYRVLLRIEATDEKEGDSNLAVLGVGPGVVHSGAVAGFPLPVLRYYVGSGPESQLLSAISLLTPTDKFLFSQADIIEFTWLVTPAAVFYRLEVIDAAKQPVLSALQLAAKPSYRAPSWLKEKLRDSNVQWRVVALDREGRVVSESAWRDFRVISQTVK